MNLKKSIAISAILHMSLLLISLHAGSGQKSHGKGTGNGDELTGNGSKYQGAKINGQVIPKERPTEVTIIETEKDGLEKKKELTKDIKECPGLWYGGIGIEDGPTSQGEMITKVFKGYPADLAGIRVGEIILKIDEDQIIGQPGTTLHMLTNKGAYIITRGKICY